MGLSQRTIVALYYAVSAAFGALALLIEGRLIKLITLGLLGTITIAALALLSRNTGGRQTTADD
jgi:hypothetical protein